APLRTAAVRAARSVIDAARAGDAPAALPPLRGLRLLCAHRLGARGLARWMERIERWLSAEAGGVQIEGRWYPGRPLLVTENDYGLRLYNGDSRDDVSHRTGAGAHAVT